MHNPDSCECDNPMVYSTNGPAYDEGAWGGSYDDEDLYEQGWEELKTARAAALTVPAVKDAARELVRVADALNSLIIGETRGGMSDNAYTEGLADEDLSCEDLLYMIDEIKSMFKLEEPK